jgi:hypothetical protein
VHLLATISIYESTLWPINLNFVLTAPLAQMMRKSTRRFHSLNDCYNYRGEPKIVGAPFLSFTFENLGSAAGRR